MTTPIKPATRAEVKWLKEHREDRPEFTANVIATLESWEPEMREASLFRCPCCEIEPEISRRIYKLLEQWNA